MGKNNIELKPMLKITEMVDYLKEKNIKFEKITEEEAEKYLKNNVNYYNLVSYKNNFEKYIRQGQFIDKFIDLDFAYLKDLSIIDSQIRLVLFKIIIEIEHSLKIRILNIVETIENEDGYKLVNKYLEKDFNNKKRPRKVHDSIKHNVTSEYFQKIFFKYNWDEDTKIENIPVWEFLEIITFGELINFFDYLTIESGLKKENTDVFIFREILKLRNAVAHNTLLLNDLNTKNNINPPAYKIIQYLNKKGISKTTRNKKLCNSRIRQITYTLYMFDVSVIDSELKKDIKRELKNIYYIRILLHKDYYNNNELLKSIYKYFEKILNDM